MGDDTTTTNERNHTDQTASFHQNSSTALAIDRVPGAHRIHREKSNSDLENVWRRGSYQEEQRGVREPGADKLAEQAKKAEKKLKKEEKRREMEEQLLRMKEK